MDRETRDMLLETADRFFTERCGRDVVNGVEKGTWPADLWKEIEEMGLPLIAVPEDKGGVGRHLGRHAGAAAAGRLARRAGAARRDGARQPADAAAGGEPKPGPAAAGAGQPDALGRPAQRQGRARAFRFGRRPLRRLAGGTLAVVAKAQRQDRGQAQPCRRALRHGDVRQCCRRIQRRLAGQCRARASSWPPSCAPCRWRARPTRCWRPPSNIPSSACSSAARSRPSRPSSTCWPSWRAAWPPPSPRPKRRRAMPTKAGS